MQETEAPDCIAVGVDHGHGDGDATMLAFRRGREFLFVGTPEEILQFVADAQRYRWLRKEFVSGQLRIGMPVFCLADRGGALDLSIDSAIRSEREAK